LGRILAAHEAKLTVKIMLCQGLGECISNLFLGVDGEYLDEPLSHMFTKMMIAHIDMLCPRATLGNPCQFKGTRVVFKNLAIDVGLSTKTVKSLASTLQIMDFLFCGEPLKNACLKKFRGHNLDLLQKLNPKTMIL
jgi:hypothetical protein